MTTKPSAATLALSLALLLTPLSGHAERGASEASTLSTLPVTVSVAAPALLLSAGAQLSVVAVETSAEGTVWVLERASDGVRASLRFTGKVLGGTALVAGTVVAVSVVATGTVLSVAGEAIAFVPNAVGKALLYNERISP